jgi:transcriptional regulator with XRE-family HTH domain
VHFSLFKEDNSVATFAERLKSLRIENNITQNDLARVLGFQSKSTITNYESNLRTPGNKTLTRIAKYFDVSTDYLLGLTDNKKAN